MRDGGVGAGEMQANKGEREGAEAACSGASAVFRVWGTVNLRESGGGGDYEYGKDIVLQVVLRSTDNIDIAVLQWMCRV